MHVVPQAGREAAPQGSVQAVHGGSVECVMRAPAGPLRASPARRAPLARRAAMRQTWRRRRSSCSRAPRAPPQAACRPSATPACGRPSLTASTRTSTRSDGDQKGQKEERLGHVTRGRQPRLPTLPATADCAARPPTLPLTLPSTAARLLRRRLRPTPVWRRSTAQLRCLTTRLRWAHACLLRHRAPWVQHGREPQGRERLRLCDFHFCAGDACIAW